MFSLSEKFALSLRWDSVEYSLDGSCRLIGAYFFGPALQIAAAVNPCDFIMLDFYSQYIYLVDTAFVGKLAWNEVVYSKDSKKITLTDSTISHPTELNKVPRLNDNDWLLIDTSDHSSDIHMFNLVYKTYVMKEDKDLYRFSNG